jgi:ferredoxin
VRWTLDASCAEVCPIECFHPAPGEEGFERATMLYVDPSECTDCNACLEVCPVDAPLLEADVPDPWERFAAINEAYYTAGLEAPGRAYSGRAIALATLAGGGADALVVAAGHPWPGLATGVGVFAATMALLGESPARGSHRFA